MIHLHTILYTTVWNTTCKSTTWNNRIEFTTMKEITHTQHHVTKKKYTVNDASHGKSHNVSHTVSN